jgi:hypothetical protein
MIRFLTTRRFILCVLFVFSSTAELSRQSFAQTIVNSYNRQRSGTIQIILQPAWISSDTARPKGAPHSAIYPYDTHIPLIFMGWGIKRGETVRPTNITDIAPTIAALLHIQTPDGNVGTPISEALKLQ